MATQRQDGWATDTGPSVSDTRGKEFCFATRVAAGLDVCGAGGKIAGVFSEGRPIGYHASINTSGHPLKVIAGGAIAVGDNVQSDANGHAITGSTNPFGTARNATAAAGEYVEIETDRT